MNCFACDSRTKKGCGDPFNVTAVDSPKLCHGCCVKIVFNRHTRKSGCLLYFN